MEVEAGVEAGVEAEAKYSSTSHWPMTGMRSGYLRVSLTMPSSPVRSATNDGGRPSSCSGLKKSVVASSPRFLPKAAHAAASASSSLCSSVRSSSESARPPRLKSATWLGSGLG